jgi:alanine dehydrogenase
MEFRVGMIPDGVRQLVEAGHAVLVERGAGEGSGFSDSDFAHAGARLVDTQEVFGAPELIVKVKEPQPIEIARMCAEQSIFTYLHLAAAPELAEALCAADVVAIAYETIQNPDGSFPVLAPMSEVAGRLAVQIGVTLLQKDRGGKGLLLGGVPGVMRGRVTVLGAGIVGINAARVAHALGAEVDVLDVDLKRLTYLYDIFGGEINTLFSNPANIARSVAASDLVVGAVYLRGRRAPILVTEKMIASMQPGSVVADVAVDQGGCVENHPLQPDLPGPRHHSLRRRQHARRRPSNVDLRPREHHAPVRGANGVGRRGGCSSRRPGPGDGRERLARKHRLRGRRRIARYSLPRAGGAALAGPASGSRT